MIPLRDQNPTSRPAVVTFLLILVNVAVYFFIQPHDMTRRGGGVQEARFTYEHAAIPCEVVNDRPLTSNEVIRSVRGNHEGCEDGHPSSPAPFPHKAVYLAIIYSMFLHGSLLHIGGNMLFLWIFGNNIEDRMGPFLYLLFYFAGGLVAAAAHIASQPDSTVPVVGASGAIAAVMGAYLVLFPNAPIRTVFIFFLILIRDISAKWLLLFWFVSQFFVAPTQGIAWVAHVGGFLFGALVALLFRNRLRGSPVPAAY